MMPNECCSECQAPETSDVFCLIDRYAQRGPGLPEGRPIVLRCPWCCERLGLSWCVSCYGWTPLALLDNKTEFCPECTAAKTEKVTSN